MANVHKDFHGAMNYSFQYLFNRYLDYCKHCDFLYRRVIEKYGSIYDYEYKDEYLGKCRLKVKK